MLDRLFSQFKIKKIGVDNTYRGEFVTYAKDQYDCDVEIKSPTQKEFKPIKNDGLLREHLQGSHEIDG